jgi:hypothetical protein
MKREKRLTKREKKAIAPRPQGMATGGHDHHHHIHCTACGKHLDLEMFESTPPEAAWLRCDHGSEFASCVEHTEKTREMLAEHDRTGKPVAHVEAWH